MQYFVVLSEIPCKKVDRMMFYMINGRASDKKCTSVDT